MIRFNYRVLAPRGCGPRVMGRDSIAIRQSHAHGLVIAGQISLSCVPSFVCLESSVTEPVVASASAVLDKVWC